MSVEFEFRQGWYGRFVSHSARFPSTVKQKPNINNMFLEKGSGPLSSLSGHAVARLLLGIGCQTLPVLETKSSADRKIDGSYHPCVKAQRLFTVVQHGVRSLYASKRTTWCSFVGSAQRGDGSSVTWCSLLGRKPWLIALAVTRWSFVV